MRHNNKARTRIIAVASCLILMSAVVASLAYFVSVKSVKNTFVMGDIDITLTETDTEYKMQPGITIHKNPILTVMQGSIESWIFIKAEESSNLKNYISYEIITGDNGWTQLKDDDGQDVTNVYYRIYTRNYKSDVEYHIIKDSVVTVIDTVTKEKLDDLRDGKDTNPTLSFTGYGVEKTEDMTAYEAWTKINEN